MNVIDDIAPIRNDIRSLITAALCPVVCVLIFMSLYAPYMNKEMGALQGTSFAANAAPRIMAFVILASSMMVAASVNMGQAFDKRRTPVGIYVLGRMVLSNALALSLLPWLAVTVCVVIVRTTMEPVYWRLAYSWVGIAGYYSSVFVLSCIAVMVSGCCSCWIHRRNVALVLSLFMIILIASPIVVWASQIYFDGWLPLGLLLALGVSIGIVFLFLLSRAVVCSGPRVP